MNSELRLILKVQKTGKFKYAEQLIKTYYDEIYIYAYRQTSNKDIAMDLTQDIFVSVLKSINKYDHTISSFRTWVYRIATNKIIDYFRSNSLKNKVTLVAEGINICDETDFVKMIENKDLTARLQTYVNTLEIDIQKIFRLKFFGEKTFAEISILLYLPESTIKSKYYRLINQLRREFINEYTDAQ